MKLKKNKKKEKSQRLSIYTKSLSLSSLSFPPVRQKNKIKKHPPAFNSSVAFARAILFGSTVTTISR